MRENKNKDLIETCKEIFYLFDQGDARLISEIASVTKEPFTNKVSNFLCKHGGKKMEDECYNCWFQVMPVSFAYGFVIGSMLNPDSKISLKGLLRLKKSITENIF